VPRGNLYMIENISDRDAKLFFAQARKIPVSEEEAPPVVISRRSRTSGASDASGASSGGEGTGKPRRKSG
jgi:centromere protein C